MFGGNVGKENQHVKCRRRCRAISMKKIRRTRNYCRKKRGGYCWRTQKCRSLWIIQAFFEGKKAGEAYARKRGPGTLKEVRQQYPPDFRDFPVGNSCL